MCEKVAIEMAPHLSMVVIQLSTAGYVVLSQAILIQGTSSIILAFYSFLSATIYMGILAVIFESVKAREASTQHMVWKRKAFRNIDIGLWCSCSYFWTNGPALLKLPLTKTMGASRFGYWFLGIAMAFIASLGTSIWIIYMCCRVGVDIDRPVHFPMVHVQRRKNLFKYR
ncbi:hypothetical protein Scep_010787 [Stephania cephalantha]|uniref:Uncharacterized protein n=1 Tax=Stephania cephalantha TaxID=152367 RepID=A0AAP0JW13_9MAGN